MAVTAWVASRRARGGISIAVEERSRWGSCCGGTAVGAYVDEVMERTSVYVYVGRNRGMFTEGPGRWRPVARFWRVGHISGRMNDGKTDVRLALMSTTTDR